MGIFASQYKYRKSTTSISSSPPERLRGINVHTDTADNAFELLGENNFLDDAVSIDEICTDLPFYNMYLAEDSFQTDLHIDAGHSSFMASMCVGKKLWRVMTNQDFAAVYEALGGIDGKLINETLVLGSFPSPFNTWHDDNEDFILKSLDVTVYEGILEPGQIIYIPAGAPHAATTLDKSLMVASNDHTLQNLREAVEYCDTLEDAHIACPGFRQKLNSMEKSLHLLKDMEKIETSLPVGTGCEKTFGLLKNISVEGILNVTSDNFGTLIRRVLSLFSRVKRIVGHACIC